MVKEKLVLDKERTHLANERTALAHLRTAFAAFIFGFALLQFSNNSLFINYFGAVMIIIGSMFVVSGPVRYQRIRKRIKNNDKF